MSSLLKIKAPGKLFLFGEYGVLARGLALVAAVERGAYASSVSDQNQYQMITQGGQALAPGEGDEALPRAVLKAAGLGDERLKTLSTDVQEMFQGDSKLGLGSSAASTAALVTLLSELEETAKTLDARFAWAFEAHRALQGGRGSGADVASSLYGGLISYRLEAPQAPFPALSVEDVSEASQRYAHIKPLRWPKGLRIEAVWLGEPAKSTALIGQVERGLAHDAVGVMGALAHADELATLAAAAMETGDISALCALVERADQAMGGLGELVEAPIIVEAHRALRAHLEGTGLVTKPSGAGGGDFSLIVGEQGQPWDEVLETLPQGCAHIPMRFNAPGARSL